MCDFDLTEFEFKGQRIPYDACSDKTLEKAKAFFGGNYKYLGSGYIIYLNDEKNFCKKETHFFKLKAKQ
jgi:hypothetical protein